MLPLPSLSLASLARLRAKSRPAWRRGADRETAAVVVDWRDFGSGVHHVSTTADLSTRGAFVCTLQPRPIGSPLVLALETGRGTVEVHGRVAWADPRGMGVRFTRPAPVAIW